MVLDMHGSVVLLEIFIDSSTVTCLKIVIVSTNISVSIRWFCIKSGTPNLFSLRVHQTLILYIMAWNCVFKM